MSDRQNPQDRQEPNGTLTDETQPRSGETDKRDDNDAANESDPAANSQNNG